MHVGTYRLIRSQLGRRPCTICRGYSYVQMWVQDYTNIILLHVTNSVTGHPLACNLSSILELVLMRFNYGVWYNNPRGALGPCVLYTATYVTLLARPCACALHLSVPLNCMVMHPYHNALIR